MKSLTIQTYKDRYPTSFVLPRISRHQIDLKRFFPGRFIHNSYDGVTIMQRLQAPDLTHAWNRVPVNPGRFIISFESHLPRVFDRRAPFTNQVENWMRKRICSNDCRRITALSHYAKRQFLEQNADHPDLEAMTEKLIVRYPNVILGETNQSRIERVPERLEVVFVGGHFARKGGLAVLRLAEMCDAANLPVKFTLVSSLAMGEAIWTDPPSADFYRSYERLYNLPNVEILSTLSNQDVRALFAKSDLSILPTIADSFGYSVVESMAEYCVPIASETGVFPEFIQQGENGFLLPAETSSDGSWIGNERHDQRHSKAYEELFGGQMDAYASAAYETIQSILANPSQLIQMRHNARATVERLFSPEASSAFWDDAYERWVEEPIASVPKNGPLDVDVPSLV
ncbi:MAG: glycosyltransferase family 4 protein [Pseudomonadota bacterium]